MRIFRAVAMIGLLAGPAHAQTAPVQAYGEPDKEKSSAEIEAERKTERAYKKSLGNVPEAGVADPWGNVRSDGAPKTATKQAPAKRIKSANPVN